MISLMQDNHRKRHGNREALGTSLGLLSCFGIAGEIGGKIHTLYEEEIAELYHCLKTQQEQ